MPRRTALGCYVVASATSLPTVASHLFTHPITAQQKHKILFAGLWDKTIKTWDVETQVLLSTSTGHVGFVKSIHIIPNLGLLVSGSTDRDIRLWDCEQSIERSRLRMPWKTPRRVSQSSTLHP
ncbi:hypothetical protein PtB15_2B227 [Puccinia triticina]|nr:hypothetical protein PtB15_2B227 [Puccinia triticina]